MKRWWIHILIVLILLILALPKIIHSEDFFFPVQEGNIWIYVQSSFGYGPPSPPDTTVEMVSIHLIDGQTYWRFRFLPPSPWSFFRIDDKGNTWVGMREEGNGIERFLNYMDQNPELKESEYYREADMFKNLNPDQKDLLVYEFDGIMPDLSYGSLDRRVYSAYLELQFESLELQMTIGRQNDPAPNRRAFGFNSDAGERSGYIVFEKGLGIVRDHAFSGISTREWETTLLWARVNGVEWGEHPGPGYPGYKTSVESQTWGEVKFNRIKDK